MSTRNPRRYYEPIPDCAWAVHLVQRSLREVFMRLRGLGLVLILVAIVFATACSKSPDQQSQAGDEQSQADQKGEKSGLFGSKKAEVKTVPEGTVLTVRLGQSVGSKISSTGDTFAASLAQPVEKDGVVLIPAGAEATGTVADAAPLGRFKGGARLRLVLDSITIKGKRYDISTTGVSRSQKGKGKRTGVMVGGGAGVGALIGGLAGGGKGAAIGALAGAGAGTAGAAYTGNKNIVLPAETALTFKLTQPLEIKQ